MYPNPSTRYTPPLPHHLVNPPPPPPTARSASPASTTTANRPRRDPKARNANGGRRSSRLIEEEAAQNVYSGVKERLGNPVLTDLVDGNKALGEIAKRHWDKVILRESEVLEEFTWALRNRPRPNRPALHT